MSADLQCKICGEWKPELDFKLCNGQRKSPCHACHNLASKKRRDSNLEMYRKREAEKRLIIRRTLDIEGYPESAKCSGCKVVKPISDFALRKSTRWWYCKPCQAANKHRQYLKHKPQIIAKAIKWNRDHPEKAAASIRNWQANNLERSRVNARNYVRNRLRSDINYKLLSKLRLRLRQMLKDQRCSKTKSAKELPGCSIEDFRIYIASRFEPGMEWGNYGKVWEIDHILPCALFTMGNLEHQKICFHFSNLRPMLVSSNRKKSDKLPDGRKARDIRREASL